MTYLTPQVIVQSLHFIKPTCLALVLAAALPESAGASVVASTNFDGRVLDPPNTATQLNWTLEGVQDPGGIAAFQANGVTPQPLFNNTALTQNMFAPALNTGNGNTFWIADVPLTPLGGGPAPAIETVAFDYWAINGSGLQNVTRSADFDVEIFDPSMNSLGSVSANVTNSSVTSPGVGTPVALTFNPPIELSDPGTYILRIRGGDIINDETGNHTAIDNLSINAPSTNDVTPPTPNPMTFEVEPTAVGQFSITMTATQASDPNGVEYRFIETSGAPGGSSSDWQDSRTFIDTGLQPNTTYTYRVEARDKSPNQNTTQPSEAFSATTDAEDTLAPQPDPMTFAVLPFRDGATALTMTATTATDESDVEYLFENLTNQTDSGWQTSPSWTDTGLDPATLYEYRVTARDTSPNQNTTAPSEPVWGITEIELAGNEILATRFINRTVSGLIASNIDYLRNGVADPGDLTASNAVALFDSTDSQGFFAPNDNPADWSVDIPITVEADSLVMGDVLIDFRSFAFGGLLKRSLANNPTPHDGRVELFDSAMSSIGSQQISAPAGSLLGWSGSFDALAGTPLNAGASYTLRISVVNGVPGNHVAIDNFRIMPGAPPSVQETLVIDLGAGTQIEGGTYGTYGATNLPLPVLPPGSILRSISVNATLEETDNDNFASDLTILLDPTPETSGGDFSLAITNGLIDFGAELKLGWPIAADAGPVTDLIDAKNFTAWSAIGAIDLSTHGVFLGNGFGGPETGGTWSGTITLSYDAVVASGGFLEWSGGAAPEDDSNGDGVPNAIAWVLGAVDPTENALPRLPILDNTSDPDFAIFTFDRANTANNDPNTTIAVQYSNDLANWTIAEHNGTDVIIDMIPGSTTDTVAVKINRAPLAAGGKLFVRLAVDVVTP